MQEQPNSLPLSCRETVSSCPFSVWANSNFIKQRRGCQDVTSSLLSAQHGEVLDGGLCHHRQTRIIQLFSAIIFRRREWDRCSKDVAWHLIKSSGGAWLRLSRLFNTAETLHQAVIATYSLAEMVPIAQKDGSSYQRWSAYWNLLRFFSRSEVWLTECPQLFQWTSIANSFPNYLKSKTFCPC